MGGAGLAPHFPQRPRTGEYRLPRVRHLPEAGNKLGHTLPSELKLQPELQTGEMGVILLALEGATALALMESQPASLPRAINCSLRPVGVVSHPFKDVETD